MIGALWYIISTTIVVFHWFSQILPTKHSWLYMVGNLVTNWTIIKFINHMKGDRRKTCVVLCTGHFQSEIVLSSLKHICAWQKVGLSQTPLRDYDSTVPLLHFFLQTHLLLQWYFYFVLTSSKRIHSHTSICLLRINIQIYVCYIRTQSHMMQCASKSSVTWVVSIYDYGQFVSVINQVNNVKLVSSQIDVGIFRLCLYLFSTTICIL